MLTSKQRQIASFGSRSKRWTIVSGPIGSGKTHAACIGFLLWMRQYGNCEFGILTKTRGQLDAVLKDGMERALGFGLPKSAKSFGVPGANSSFNKVHALVANDIAAEQRLRSFNLVGMLIDEATTLPSGILAAANGRCRVGDSKLLVLTNPDGPKHPLKTTYMDRADEVNAEVIYTDLYDNPRITEAYIESLKQSYSGHMLERMVYGRWVAAEGLVFPHLLDKIGIPDWSKFLAFDVSIDVGEATVTHAVLTGRNVDGETWVIGECRHDHQRQGVLTVRDLVTKVRRSFADYDVHSWMVDPAAKAFREELEAQLPDANIGKAENDFYEGVEEVNHWVARDALFMIEDEVPHLIAEIAAYVWDKDKAEKGIDEPKKTSDHGCDALRYMVFTRTVHEAGGRRLWERKEGKTR